MVPAQLCVAHPVMELMLSSVRHSSPFQDYALHALLFII